MAVRLVKWTLEIVNTDENKKAVLKMVKPLENATGEIVAEFNLIELFPDFLSLTDVQQQVVAYGTKQKLSDKGANEVANLGGKVTNAKAIWATLLEGKWSGDRMNATGAAENKTALANMKAAAKVLDFNGLMAKKLMGVETFTPEDEQNLQKFMKIMLEQNAKNAQK
jgi:hypothetical protein